MTQTETDFLRQHDWHSVACQCPEHRCHNRARFVVHIHAIDRCNDAGLLHGDRVELRCDPCVLGLYRAVGQRLRRYRRDPLQCPTCGAPLAAVSDVVREIREI
jgi:hypothetical protein